jgi:hypothetical protein
VLTTSSCSKESREEAARIIRLQIRARWFLGV